MKKTCILLMIYLVSCLGAMALDNQNYLKAWEAMGKNDRAEARKLFTEAINSSDTKADAYLSLAFLDWTEMKLDNAFDSFTKFYAASTNPYPYLYSVNVLPFMFESDNSLPAKKVEFYEKLLNDPKMNGILKAGIANKLGDHFDKVNNIKKSRELFSRVGAINNWQVLGSFDNTSGSGFSKDWGALTKMQSTDMFKNKVDADVTWYNPPYNKPNNWFYFDYYFYLNDVVVYAQSFVDSPEEMEVYMRTGTSGSLKVWVNDALATSVSEERNCDLDIYTSKVKLNKGVNRVLVQIGQSEITSANFLLRFTNENGDPVSGLTSKAQYADYSKSTATYDTNPLPFFAETFFADKVKQNPDDLLSLLLLGETYLRNDKAHEATAVLKQLEAKLPNSSLVAHRLAEAYARAKNQTDYDKEMENIKRLDPNSFEGLRLAYSEAMKSEKYTDAADISKKAKDLYGVNAVTEDWDITIASRLKKYEDVIAMAKVLYRKYPENANYMSINYQIEKSVNGDAKAGIAVLENYCKNYYNSDALEALSKAYIEQGNVEKGFNVLKQRIERVPYANGFIDELINEYYRKQRYAEALAVSDKFLALSPYLSGIYNSRGYIFKGLKDDAKAKESFQKSIYYGPTSYDSRTQLRLLNNKKEINELFPKNDLDQMIAKAPTAKEYPQDNSVMLLNEYQVVYYPEGAKEYRYELAAKILNQAGIESWKDYQISYNSNNQKLIVDKAEVIKANGSKVKAETNNDDHVVFTNLEVNDVLHLDYRIQDLSTGKMAKHLSDHFLFQYTVPSVLNRYSILVPKDKKFEYTVANGSIQPKISEVEDMTLYQWESANQTAVKDEPVMSALVDVVPTLYYSSIPDWNYVGEWYRDLTCSKLHADYVLKETVNNLMKGKEKLTPMEKARIFYNYILENISYSNVSFMHSNFIPQKASRTITTRLGDCKDVSTLFVAMCREVGIDANLVLISTRDYGSNTMKLPAIDFNHCIAQLNIEKKAYYLELTDNMLPFGSALTVDLNSQILPIPFAENAPKTSLIKMAMEKRPVNQTRRLHTVNFQNNDMLIDRKSTQYAAFSSSIRHNYRDIGTDEQLKEMNKAVASDFSVPIKITDLKFVNLDNLADSVSISYSLEAKNVLQTVAGMKVFTLPWTEKVSSLTEVAEETRKYPIELWAMNNDEVNVEEITINLPKGKMFVEAPQNTSFDCANASYQLIVNNKIPGKLIVRRVFKRKTDVVTVPEYAAFRDFMNKVSEADNKQYAFK